MIKYISIVMMLLFGNAWSGEVANSKLGKAIENSGQQHQDALIGHTEKWTEKLRVLVREVNLNIQKANELGLNPLACHSIKSDEAKVSCLASINAAVKEDISPCFQIKDKDDLNGCIASIKNQVSYCYSIVDKDSRFGCIAGIEQNKGMCYAIKREDDRFGCIAGIEQNKGMCFAIKNEDARWGCLAGFPP